jgi:predicted acetyltransferase
MALSAAMNRPQPVALVPALPADRPVIQAMARFYVYDMSEYTGWPVPADGLYECVDLAPYWTEAGAHAFFIECGDEHAGFAMVDRLCMFPDTEFNVGEFFVLRKFKGRGVGRAAAMAMFERFPGRWEVKQLVDNAAGIAFWRKVIGACCGNRFDDAMRLVPYLGYEMNVMRFDSRERSSRGPAPDR